MWNNFGTGYIPHNVILDHNMEVIYSESGFSEVAITSVIQTALENLPSDTDLDGLDDPDDNCPEVYNPEQNNVDEDTLGDMCDPCDNANVFVTGNVNGHLDLNGNPVRDVLDVLSLVEVILPGGVEGDLATCMFEASNINEDANVNVLDVITLVNQLKTGDLRNLSHPNESIAKKSFRRENHISFVEFYNSDLISGYQFEIVNSNVNSYELSQIVVPMGWDISFAKGETHYVVIAADISGENPQIALSIQLPSSDEKLLNSMALSSPTGSRIKVEDAADQMPPSTPKNFIINKLYPNPFNPSLSISFELYNDSEVSIHVFNGLGELVDTINEKVNYNTGLHKVNWSASSNPSGMYFIQIKTPLSTLVEKAILIK